jgi:hypothetical protein
LGEEAIATGVVEAVNSETVAFGLHGLEFFELFGCEDRFDVSEELGANHGEIAFGRADCGGGGANVGFGCAGLDGGAEAGARVADFERLTFHGVFLGSEFRFDFGDLVVGKVEGVFDLAGLEGLVVPVRGGIFGVRPGGEGSGGKECEGGEGEEGEDGFFHGTLTYEDGRRNVTGWRKDF